MGAQPRGMAAAAQPERHPCRRETGLPAPGGWDKPLSAPVLGQEGGEGCVTVRRQYGQKPINGERRPDIKVCIGAGGYGVLLNDVLMKGNPKQLQKFIQEVLYDSLTPYEWLPSFIKEYLRDHPDEIDEYLPKSK